MSKDLFDLTGRIALVTGSSQGLGLVLARGLGEAGATVVLNGRNKKRLSDAVDTLADAGLNAHGCAFDVTEADAIDRAVGPIEDDVGPIDILVNNAGVQRRGPLESLDEAAWREVVDTNLTGPFLVSRRVARGMIERRRGKIINICSLMSELGRETTGNYAASKGGLKMLTRAMAVEWARHNIQANGIGPGYFLTEMTRKLADDPEFDAWIRGRTPAGRWGDPDELIGAAVFLASAASDFVNGQILYVDGGILAAL
ncbi:MAG TPA: SDR family NAD(P)-dependent oxidoreductase [Phycisphaerae bacterium]|nr:SDR family NAD(P)-dependent oxidoreductase [Phycisphaerae bacterium]